MDQSYRDYSIPLALRALEAEVVYRAGVWREQVVLPESFSPRSYVTNIVAGGQTGVDRAALDFGLERKIQIGGWCPKGRYAEDGPIPAKYSLRETESGEVTARTELNARDSDGTLVLAENHLMRGTGYTREMALRHGKPFWIQPVDLPIDPQEFAKWIYGNEIRTLNIGGPRESDEPGCVYTKTLLILDRILY